MKKLILLFVITYCVFLSTYGDNSYNILEGLTNEQTQYPSCSIADKYWYQQSGPDKVSIPQIESSSSYITADQLDGQESGVHHLSGNVLGYQDDKTFLADWLFYNQQTSQITAGDHVVLTRQYDIITGEWMTYYLNLDKGTINKATVYQNKTTMYTTGDKITVYDKKHYTVDNTFMTTCNLNDPAWFIRAKEVNLDYQDSQGNARGATFYAESVPIIYMPYFQFPLGERRSGFLMPEYGYNSNSGFTLGTPYYLNLAPNYDMTLEPKVFSEKGAMLGAEFRYLTSQDTGRIYTEQVSDTFDTNTINPQYRWYWHLDETHTVNKDITMGYDYNQVSDNNYFVDFGNFYSTTDNTNLNQMVYANYTPSWGFLGIKAQQYQTLQPTGQTTTAAIYAAKPQVNMTINPVDTGIGIKAGMIGQYTYFTSGILTAGQSALQTGQRFVAYPSLTAPMDTSWGFIHPKVGYNFTNYQLDPYSTSGSNTIIRGLPITSLDSGLTFDRPTNLAGNLYSQTFEPRLYYLYIPQVNQGNIPLFDTAPATYNLNQLFSENRFSGYDRINSANDVTMGVTQRLINDNNGIEIANLGVGYRYYLNQPDEFLYGNYNEYQQLYNPPPPDFITELNNRWANGLTTNATFQYSSTYNNVPGYSAGLRYSPEEYKILNLKYTYTYQLPLFITAWTPGQVYQPTEYINQYAVDLSGQWPIYANRWFVEGRANYDLTRSMWLNQLAGIQYNGGCWIAHLMYQNYVTNINQTTQAIFFQIELKGLTSVGNSDPGYNLKMNIPGYMPVTNNVQ